MSLSVSLLAYSFGYLTFDLYIIFMDIRDFSALGLQNIAHHFICITATVGALIAGGFNVNVGAATLFTEISTIFLHVRFYMIKAKIAKGPKFIGIMLIFIATFFYSRIYV